MRVAAAPGASLPHTYSHSELPGLLTEPMLSCLSHRPLLRSTSRLSSSDRTSDKAATASRNTGPSSVSFSMPHMATLGWLRSRSTISRTDNS